MVEIKGLEKFAPKDFPGYIASTVFVGGCNFRCPFCHNADLVLRPDSLPSFPMDYFLSYLDSRKNWLEAICISGGEPLMQPELDVLLRIIKDRNLLAKIDTNGAFPDKLKGLLEQDLLDFVAMDVKGPLEKYEKVTASAVRTEDLMRSIELIKDSGLDYVFRTTAVPGFVDAEGIEAIGRLLAGSQYYQIQQYEPLNALDEKLQEVIPYGKDDLEAMAERVKPYFDRVSIEGI